MIEALKPWLEARLAEISKGGKLVTLWPASPTAELMPWAWATAKARAIPNAA